MRIVSLKVLCKNVVSGMYEFQPGSDEDEGRRILEGLETHDAVERDEIDRRSVYVGNVSLTSRRLICNSGGLWRHPNRTSGAF